MKKEITCIIAIIMCLSLTGCSIPKYSEEEYISAKDTAYEDGYNDGHKDGYEEGKTDGYEDGFIIGRKSSSNSNTPETTSSSYSPTTVFVTPSGSKYHRFDCFYLDGAAYTISYDSPEQAESAGYGSCSRCF